MKILVTSCDKNSDLFDIFHHCIEKYWPNHPELFYMTETIDNPYYKTIKVNYPINKWSRRVRDSASQIDDNIIMIMCDDCFIRSNVNLPDLHELSGNVASINTQPIPIDGGSINFNEVYVKRMTTYKTSVMLSVWQKDKLLDVFNCDYNPWDFEMQNRCLNYTYLVSKEPLIDIGRKLWSEGAWGIVRGKWSRNEVEWAKKENLDIDFDKRGFWR